MSKKLFFLCIIMLASFYLHAQILDDSTQTVYGPRTTNFKYINDIKFNRNVSSHPDTSIVGFERFSYMENMDYEIQDLGNIGTSAKHIYYQPPSIIGWTSGYYTYDFYDWPVEKIQLFNTRSPYTNLYVGFANRNRNITRITHSQSIKPNWNFGINLQWLTMDKQISRTGRGDNQVRGLDYNIYMYHWTTDSSYFVMGAFNRMNHKVVEIGGVDTLGFSDMDDYFDENAEINLQNANSRELRMRYYLYQQYQLNPSFAIYNEFSRSLTSNYYEDPNISLNAFYYDYLLFSTDENWNKDKFNDLTNEAGIKGDWKNAFYNLYYKYRTLSFYQLYYPEIERRTEGYVGGSLRYDNDTTYFLSVSGELMLNNGNHQISAIYENRLWELSYKRRMYDPGAIHERYFSNYYEWYNDFVAVQSDNFRALFKIDLKRFSFRPFLNLSLIKNYIYFNTDKQPSQATGFAQLYSPGIHLNIQFGKYLFWENQFIYTFKTGEEEASDVFRIPPIFANSNFYFRKFMFNEKLLMSLGIKAHYQSNYYADGYDPVTQQFYLQNDFEIPGYLIADVYANLKIRTVRIFVKYYYINQEQGSGYFATPYYPGQPGGIDLGLSWMFYD